MERATGTRRRGDGATLEHFLTWLSCMTWGEGVKRSPRKAFLLYKKGAQKGDPWAQCNLAVAYRKGMGTKKNIREGIRWLRRAAYQDDSSAEYNLGQAYLDGAGVRKSPAAGRVWLRRAAGHGHKKAARLLKRNRSGSRR